MGRSVGEAWRESDYKVPVVLSIASGILISFMFFAARGGLIDLSYFYIDSIRGNVGDMITAGSWVIMVSLVPYYLLTLTYPKDALGIGVTMVILSLLSLLSSSVGGLFIGAALGVVGGVMAISKGIEKRRNASGTKLE